jgi:hypothetical protein
MWQNLRMSEPEEKLQPAWCIVANVVHERPYGDGGAEIRRGTKQFAPSAKVRIVSFRRVGEENVTVVGRHRKSHRYITLITLCKWLVNWRVELVYSPHILPEIIAYENYNRVLKWYESWFLYHCLAMLGMIREQQDADWASSDEARKVAETLLQIRKEWHESARIVQPPVIRSSQHKRN